jgi:hypothetical protein
MLLFNQLTDSQTDFVAISANKAEFPFAGIGDVGCSGLAECIFHHGWSMFRWSSIICKTTVL